MRHAGGNVLAPVACVLIPPRDAMVALDLRSPAAIAFDQRRIDVRQLPPGAEAAGAYPRIRVVLDVVVDEDAPRSRCARDTLPVVDRGCCCFDRHADDATPGPLARRLARGAERKDPC
jgi:hypothetical protein